jgi:hypothetical protein
MATSIGVASSLFLAGLVAGVVGARRSCRCATVISSPTQAVRPSAQGPSGRARKCACPRQPHGGAEQCACARWVPSGTVGARVTPALTDKSRASARGVRRSRSRDAAPSGSLSRDPLRHRFFSRPTPLQRSRAVAQNLGQWISKTSWPGKFENVSAGHAFIGSRILASVALFASRDHCRTGLSH